ncbi:MFS transporter [Xenorhabdus khoisanae]|nr:MFS transporter [Xenorhabdus khoisanae]
MNSNKVMSWPLFALAISAFAIGTAEFIIMGLLPQISVDLSISIPTAGYLVSGYAIGVVIGGPLFAFALRKVEEKTALLLLMVIFIVGNLACELASGFEVLLIARVFTAFSHASFIGIAAVLASRIAPPGKEGRAMTLMLTGMTLANVLGVPAGSYIGLELGWRTTFVGVVILGLLSLFMIFILVPSKKITKSSKRENSMIGLKRPLVWLGLITSVMASASMFTFFTYIVPILQDVTHVEPKFASLALMICGIGITIGGLLGGRLADWNLTKSLVLALCILIVTLVAFYWTSYVRYPAVINMAIWGCLSFTVGMLLQVLIIRVAGESANYASTLNIGAFNLGNAIGAWIGGKVIDAGFPLNTISLVAAAISVATLIMVLIMFISNGRQLLIYRSF